MRLTWQKANGIQQRIVIFAGIPDSVGRSEGWIKSPPHYLSRSDYVQTTLRDRVQFIHRTKPGNCSVKIQSGGNKQKINDRYFFSFSAIVSDVFVYTIGFVYVVIAVGICFC